MQHSFHYVMRPLMFRLPAECGSLSSHWFSHWERGAQKRRGKDSSHCFHPDGMMMISPAAAYQPHALLLDFIKWKVAVNYWSVLGALGELVTRQVGKTTEWGADLKRETMHWDGVLFRRSPTWSNGNRIKMERKQDALAQRQMLASAWGLEWRFRSGSVPLKVA